MYRKQMKCQKILCLALLFVCAAVFIYSLGLMTDLYDSLFSTIRSQKNLDKSTVTGSRIYYDMQGFNKTSLHFSIALLLLALSLFITKTHTRRKYYIGNYLSAGLFSAGGIAFTVWFHTGIESWKTVFLNINFEELAAHAAKKKTLYSDSTFWFDAHYVVFGLLIAGIILLILNILWKRKLMKEERCLLEQGEEASV